MGYQDNFLRELVVDNFAGGGGASTGIELAIGRPVDIAINHDPEAIAMHEQNHPYTIHYCESVWDIDPIKVCGGRPVGIAWFSPDCKHFSKAKGGKPVDKHIRGLAWIALRWAAKVKPRVIFLENVEEFLTWGRVRKGKPIEKDKGNTFKRFVKQLEDLGYVVDWRILKACDYGVPTSRKRLYLIARCDGKPIIFPKPTHGEGPGKKPYRSAAEIIDWSVPCQSIFERKKPLVPATLRRIARGLDRFVINAKKPFIVPIGYGERVGQKPRVNDIEEPLSTIVSSCKQNIIEPYLTKFNDVSKGQSIKVPLDTVMAAAIRFARVDTVLSPFVEQANYENIPIDVRQPLSTQTSVVHHRIITPKIKPFVMQNYGGNYSGAGSDIDKPLPTITAQDHNALGCAFVSKYYGGTYKGAGSDVAAPLDTVTAEERHAVVSAFMTHFYKGGGTAQADSVNNPLHSITSKNKAGVVIVKLTKSDREVNNFGYWEEVRKLLNNYAGYSLAEDELLLLDVNGEKCFISDIKMRMLLPKELYAAQGFPVDYKFEFDYKGKPYSKKAQIARCGNSVCPQMAEILVRANLEDLAYKKQLKTMEELEKAVSA